MIAINLLASSALYALIGAGAFVVIIAVIAVALGVTAKKKTEEPKKSKASAREKKPASKKEAPMPAREAPKKPSQPAAAPSVPSAAPQAAPVAPQTAPEAIKEEAPTENEAPMSEVAVAVSPARVQEPPKEILDEEHAVIIKTKRLVVVDYDRSFEARLIQGDDELKAYYSELRNEIEAYKPKSRRSWKRETYRVGRKSVVRMSIRGKTLCLHFALSAKDYEDTKYKVEDVSDVASNEDTPCLYRIKNDRRMRYAKDLIATVMQAAGREKGIVTSADYAAQYPYENIEPLVLRGLAKEIIGEEEVEEYRPLPKKRKEVSVSEAQELLKSREMDVFVGQSTRYSDKTKVAIVNVDTLSEYFNDGETVGLAEMKERIPVISGKATYVKVLARGTLNKALTVEADDFSADAVRMIVLTGGKVIRTRKS